MTKSHHDSGSDQPQNQNNAMSDDPGDGSRTAFTPGKDGTAPVEKAPKHDAQDQEAIEAFGERGQAG